MARCCGAGPLYLEASVRAACGAAKTEPRPRATPGPGAVRRPAAELAFREARELS
jgi:hypothetical protein